MLIQKVQAQYKLKKSHCPILFLTKICMQENVDEHAIVYIHAKVNIQITKKCFASQDRSSLFSRAAQSAANYSNCRNSSPFPKRRKTNRTASVGENALKTKRYLAFVSTRIISEVPLEALRNSLFRWCADSSSSLGSVTLKIGLSLSVYHLVRRAPKCKDSGLLLLQGHS